MFDALGAVTGAAAERRAIFPSPPAPSLQIAHRAARDAQDSVSEYRSTSPHCSVERDRLRTVCVESAAVQRLQAPVSGRASAVVAVGTEEY